MNKNLFRSVSSLLLLLLTINGCAVMILGAGAAGGGYAISRDEIEGFTERSQETTWHAAQEVLRGSGAIIYTDPGRGLIEADVQNSRVSIEVLQVSPKTVRLHVKARKFWRMFPDMSRAQEIFSRIINELK